MSKSTIIAVAGKGGVGKTSLSATIVRCLTEKYPDKKILAIDADPAVGLSTALGIDVKMTIDEIEPYRLVDTAHLFLAKMRTSHEYVQSGDLTTIQFSVEVWGALGFFWRKVVAENQVKEAATQTAALVSYARANS